MSELIDCIDGLTAADIIRSIAKTANGLPFYLQSSGLGFDPSKIDGLEFWFDGQDTTTISLNGNKVIQWDDKSGNIRHISNAADAQRPTYNAATGRISFAIANSTYLKSIVFPGDLIQPNTVFIVYNITGFLNATGWVFDGFTTNRHSFYYTSSSFKILAGAPLTDGATDANDNIHVAEFNGVSSEYWVNSVLFAGNAGASNLNGITLGATGGLASFSDVDIMEVFGYNKELPIADRLLLEAYLTDKWGL